MNPLTNRSLLWRVLAGVCVLALLLGQQRSTQAQCEFIVTNANDSGPGSLRQALVDVCDGGTIRFAGDYTITLGAGPLSLARNVTLDGSGHQVVVSGDYQLRVFEVAAGVQAVLRELEIINGLADHGGGGVSNAGGTLTLESCVLAHHYANYGGAIYNHLGGALTLLDTTIANNWAFLGGGGIWSDAALVIRGSTLAYNTAHSSSAGLGTGGGLQIAGGTATLANTTLSGNQARGENDAGGGAIMVTAGAVALINATVAANDSWATAGGGGGICNQGGAVYLQNTLVANNSSAGSGRDLYGPVTSLDYNLIRDPAGATIGGSTGHNITGLDPYLSALGSYGGDTRTLSLLPGSPAIDAAGAAACAADPVAGVDQRGVARPAGAGCDIGAFESRGFGVQVTGGDNQAAVINTLFASPLSVQVSSAFAEPVSEGVLEFAGPSTGASTDPASRAVWIAGGGSTGAPVRANGTAGAYSVTVSAAGVITPAAFSLANRLPQQPPSATGSRVSTAEDVAYVFLFDDLGYDDPNLDPFHHLRIVSLPARGTLYLDADGDGQIDAGEALAVDDTVSAADIAAARWRYAPPADENGSPYASLLFRVHDGADESMSDSTIVIDVLPVNDPPTIAPLVDQTVAEARVLGPIPLTVGDIDTPLSSLALRATSSNPALVPDSSLVFGGAGADRTLTITPPPLTAGTATITVVVDDGAATASTAFLLTVREVRYPVYVPLVTRNLPRATGSPR